MSGPEHALSNGIWKSHCQSNKWSFGRLYTSRRSCRHLPHCCQVWSDCTLDQLVHGSEQLIGSVQKKRQQRRVGDSFYRGRLTCKFLIAYHRKCTVETATFQGRGFILKGVRLTCIGPRGVQHNYANEEGIFQNWGFILEEIRPSSIWLKDIHRNNILDEATWTLGRGGGGGRGG